MSLQLINEDKHFNLEELKPFLKRSALANAGLDYHIISVFGSQSTGKSTLLNALFNTNFNVMDAKITRQQTTKGIWMGLDQQTQPPLLILDVEGTDGRERGDDQDFERKAALFALATSEILIINMWEHQVGLYVGANMALLRTVFEVNLNLFASSNKTKQKSRLQFVLRDYVGETPLNQLYKTLLEDLEKQWQSLSKPMDLQTAKLTDFFDIGISGLPHKVLMKEQFNVEVANLKKELLNNFKPEYHRKVPLDGWDVYASKVFEQIEMNKDLDLPTHQILVSRFRCEEISDEVFHLFESDVASLNLPFGEEEVISEFGLKLKQLRTKALTQFDDTAGRYNKQVYNEKKLELLGKIDGVLSSYFNAQLNALKNASIKLFWEKFESSKQLDMSIGDRLKVAETNAINQFNLDAQQSIIDPSFFSINAHEDELKQELHREAGVARKGEVKRILKSVSKKINKRLDHINMHFEMYPVKVKNPWDATMETFENALKSVFDEMPSDFGLGASKAEVDEIKLLIEVEAWKLLVSRVRQFTTEDAVLQRMRDRFEEAFKYTKEGLPVVWSPQDDIDQAGVVAREQAQLILPVYSSAKLSNNEYVRIPPQIALKLESEDEEVFDFVVLINSEKAQSIERRFQRVADSAFIDAKRSVMQQRTHIPAYIYIVIAVLGWNEFTAVLRNPLLVVLLLLILSFAYTVHYLGMADAVRGIVEGTLHRALAEGKKYMRQLLLTEEEKRPQIKQEEKQGME